MAGSASVFVFVDNGEVECVKAFSDAKQAEAFAIPFVAERIGYALTGDGNVDWDVINTECDVPEGMLWQLRYDVPVE